MPKATKTRRPGRPAGSTTKEVPVATVATSSCAKCGSTKRSAYFNRRTIENAGRTADGTPYKRIVWRRTKCLSCGQVRDDRTFEK